MYINTSVAYTRTGSRVLFGQCMYKTYAYGTCTFQHLSHSLTVISILRDEYKIILQCTGRAAFLITEQEGCGECAVSLCVGRTWGTEGCLVTVRIFELLPLSLLNLCGS